MWNVPNILTLLRIFLIPVFVGFFYLPFTWARLACALVFGLAALTDLVDGYLARRWGQTSALGTFLDPVADKLMVAVALVLLVEADPRPLLALPAAVIIGRELAVSGLRYDGVIQILKHLLKIKANDGIVVCNQYSHGWAPGGTALCLTS